MSGTRSTLIDDKTFRETILVIDSTPDPVLHRRPGTPDARPPHPLTPFISPEVYCSLLRTLGAMRGLARMLALAAYPPVKLFNYGPLSAPKDCHPQLPATAVSCYSGFVSLS